ncbi:hypothetical protein P7C71_g6181, partial [Lecanoromycetidae sp. Uapishka_2]
MTEVLSIQQPDGNTHFGSSLRHSSSQSSFLIQSPSSYSKTHSKLNSKYAAGGYDAAKPPTSISSSAPSSPRLNALEFSNQPSFNSTPSSSLSLEDQCGQEEDIVFPSYDDGGYYDDTPEVEQAEPSPSPETAAPTTLKQSASDTSLSITASPGRSERPLIAGDDTAIECEPTRHVDYLSHNWREEDIWSSWRHIVAKRKSYSNWPRLENASWRTWAKSKHQLKTVSPETLNWMKDHDVTWLYGPLQTGNAKPMASDPTPPASRLSRSNSFASKKPILKKRSLSEVMLQRSLSSSTLMKQATDALRAQHSGTRLCARPGLAGRELSDFGTSSEIGTPLTRATTDSSSTDPSVSTSGIQTPCTKRHIHFNNKVEQCIAINKEVDEKPELYHTIHDDDDSSDDDMLIMKPVKHATKAKLGSTPTTPRNSFSSEGKTIAMLPSTTLNYRGDTPEPAEQKPKQNKAWTGGSKLSPSPSQQTLRPTSPSHNFLLDDEDEDADMNWQPAAAGSRRNSLYPRGGLELNTDDDDENDAEHSGLRRTPSGMFMPYEDENDPANAGIFGKVVDTVNTAKDIAHVIWNVGWHR